MSKEDGEKWENELDGFLPDLTYAAYVEGPDTNLINGFL